MATSLFEKPKKRGCQPLNWLLDGFRYRAKFEKGLVDSEDFPLLAPISGVHKFEEDFIAPYDSNQWDSNQVDDDSDSGEVCAVNDGVGGELTLTTNDADDDAEQRVYKTESFKLESGKKLWFEARAKMSEDTDADMVLGLIKSENLTAVSDLLPADGVVFKKDEGDTDIDFVSSKNGTDDKAEEEGTLDTDYHRYGFYYDGDGTITPYIDGEAGTALEATICDDEELAPTIMVRAGDANARTLTVDYIRVVQER